MKNKKGFTLIELLAVIVILGLLMAIAIPSITKYINQSRKKTVTASINSYINSVITSVNDLEYSFTDSNTIYAVPIECISLERGGTNPFGSWMQANDAYFAYVLIQYDGNSSYKYGFTFKDSAGYTLIPITQDLLDDKGTQIAVGLDIKRPISGNITKLTTLVHWQKSGFIVDENTQLEVLVATSEGGKGNQEEGTCTLVQKGDNYDQVEKEKEDNKIKEEENKPIPTKTFTACDLTYEYEEGMTWDEWLNSKYNTTGAYEHPDNPSNINPATIILIPSSSDGIEITGDLFETEVSTDSIYENTCYKGIPT